MRKLLALVLSLFVATAMVACGNDDADDDASGSGSGSASGSVAEDDETTTTTEGGGGEDTTTTTEGDDEPAEASGDFCEQAQVFASDTSLGELDFTDPADIAIAVGLLEDFRDASPEEIRDDLQIIIDGFETVATAMAEAGDDPEAQQQVANEMAAEVQALQTASAEVQTFTQEACGIDISGGGAAPEG